ncbi:hypothetical protein D3C80_1410630 [compost metagenome]
MDEGPVLDYGNQDLGESLANRVALLNGRELAGEEALRLLPDVGGAEVDFVLAVFSPCRDLHGAGRKLEQIARDQALDQGLAGFRGGGVVRADVVDGFGRNRALAEDVDRNTTARSRLDAAADDVP